MNLLLLSDLHLEFGDFTPPETGYDAVVLAGDVHVKRKKRRKGPAQYPALAWIDRHFTARGIPVVYVPGNHECYGGHFTETPEALREHAPAGCHVLNKAAVVLGGVRFLGATLWTDFNLYSNQPLGMWDAGRNMSDYLVVRSGPRYSRRLTPEHVLEEHNRSRTWLESQLALPFEGPTVVVTHHAPSELSVAEAYRNDPLNVAYASRLEQLFGEHAPLWVHGHTHFSFDYAVCGTRVVCNPRGYAGHAINPEFNPHLVISV